MRFPRKICILTLLIFITGYLTDIKIIREPSLKERVSVKTIDGAKKFIKEVKEFEAGLGFKETKNFVDFDENVSYSALYFQKFSDMPFSYLDPRMGFRGIDDKNLEKGVSFAKLMFTKYYGIDTTKCDFFLYLNGAWAGGTKITPGMLDKTPKDLAYTVMHEDWHDNVDLPMHIEEATCDLIGIAGTAQFLKMENANKSLRERLDFAMAINYTHKKLSDLSTLFYFKAIDTTTYYLRKRDGLHELKNKLVSLRQDTSEINAAWVSFYHVYTHYYPLMYRLYDACNADIKEFVGVLKTIPFNKLTNFEYSICFFEKTRKVDKYIEVYLEKIIQIKKQKPEK